MHASCVFIFVSADAFMMITRWRSVYPRGVIRPCLLKHVPYILLCPNNTTMRNECVFALCTTTRKRVRVHNLI